MGRAASLGIPFHVHYAAGLMVAGSVSEDFVFTGIIEEVGRVANTTPSSRGLLLTVRANAVLEGTKLGDSIAVNGVCLTVTAIDHASFCVGVAPETLKRTNIHLMTPGEEVNLERAVLPTTRLGGHFVQGHVDGMARLKGIRPDRDARWLTLEPPAQLLLYVVEKGFICLDGVSLTVVDVSARDFSVMLVSHTQDHVTLARKRSGSRINVEVDILGKYIEKLLGHSVRSDGARVTSAFLREHGFH